MDSKHNDAKYTDGSCVFLIHIAFTMYWKLGGDANFLKTFLSKTHISYALQA